MNTLILFMVRSFEWWFSCWVWRFYIVFYKNIQKILSFAKQKGFTQTIKRQSGFLILLLLLNCCDLFSFKISMLWFGFSHIIFVFWLALNKTINQEFLHWDISKKQVYSNFFINQPHVLFTCFDFECALWTKSGIPLKHGSMQSWGHRCKKE